MTDEDGKRLALYNLYLDTAERVSDRRARANAWMLSVNSAVVALYGYLGQGKSVIEDTDKEIWFWVIPASGILVCLAWATLLSSYRKLNAAKFKVLQELEQDLPYALFRREWENYKGEGRISLAFVESWIPWSFSLLYTVLLLTALR